MQDYKQCDSRWRNRGYAGSTMCIAGCGPTSVANIVDKLPTEVADKFTQMGYASNGMGTYWNGITAVLRAYGFDAKQTNTGNLYGVRNSSAEKEFLQAMKNGGTGIVLMGPSKFTNSGHFITMVRTDGNNCYIHDPYGQSGYFPWSDFQGKVKVFYYIPKKQAPIKEKLDFCMLSDPDKLRVGVAYDYKKYEGKVTFDFVYRNLSKPNVWLPIVFKSKGNWVDFVETAGNYQIVCKMYDSNGKIIVENYLNVNTVSATKVNATNASWKGENILLGFTVTDHKNKALAKVKYRAMLFDKTTGKWFDRRYGQWTEFTPTKGHKYAVMFQAYLEDKKHKDGRVIAQKQINVL